MTKPDLWIVCKKTGPERFEFAGVFDTEAIAVNACRTRSYCVCPAVLNEELPDDLVLWPGAYYPLTKEAEG